MATKSGAVRKRAPGKAVKRAKNASKNGGDGIWELRLYIAGQTPNSIAAIGNLKRICEERLQNRYRIEIIDLLEKPQLAKGDQIVAIPTLVRKLPAPVKKIIGNLSKADYTLVGLDLHRLGERASA